MNLEQAREWLAIADKRYFGYSEGDICVMTSEAINNEVPEKYRDPKPYQYAYCLFIYTEDEPQPFNTAEELLTMMQTYQDKQP